jgi:hypothetical protein
MSEPRLLDRIRRVHALREPSGRVVLLDAESGERLALGAHYSEPAWVQLLLQAEGRLEGGVTEETFHFTPRHFRPRY